MEEEIKNKLYKYPLSYTEFNYDDKNNKEIAKLALKLDELNCYFLPEELKTNLIFLKEAIIENINVLKFVDFKFDFNLFSRSEMINIFANKIDKAVEFFKKDVSDLDFFYDVYLKNNLIFDYFLKKNNINIIKKILSHKENSKELEKLDIYFINENNFVDFLLKKNYTNYLEKAIKDGTFYLLNKYNFFKIVDYFGFEKVKESIDINKINDIYIFEELIDKKYIEVKNFDEYKKNFYIKKALLKKMINKNCLKVCL